jgi:hypothetical protein
MRFHLKTQQRDAESIKRRSEVNRSFALNVAGEGVIRRLAAKNPRPAEQI